MKTLCAIALVGLTMFLPACASRYEFPSPIKVEFGGATEEWCAHVDGLFYRFRLLKNPYPEREVVVRWQAFKNGEKTPFRMCSVPLSASGSALASVGISPLHPWTPIPLHIPMRISIGSTFMWAGVELESPVVSMHLGARGGTDSWYPDVDQESDDRELATVYLFYSDAPKPDVRLRLDWRVVKSDATPSEPR